MANKNVISFDWTCPDCGLRPWSQKISKRRKEEITKEVKRFCKKCRAHKTFERKKHSSGSLGNAR